ncbi:palmitoyltransferase Pfa4p [Diutina rugosa]
MSVTSTFEVFHHLERLAMTAQLPWPLLGVVIPVIIIAFLGYGSHYILWYNEPKEVQWLHELCLHTIWLTYALAIFTDPGEPPKDFHPQRGEWKRYCQSCKRFKPPRTHHCKTCKRCVLAMDHHCPWTYNCVGHNNLPQFLRFLVAVIVGTSNLAYLLWGRLKTIYDMRNEPAYLTSKWNIFWVLIFTLVNIAVLASITLLYIRCLLNVLAGKTQIEVWEWDRVESQLLSERFWIQVRKNYRKLYGKELPKLESCRFPPKPDDNDIVPINFTIDDLIFPYDYGYIKNVYYSCGGMWTWLWPWGGSPLNGCQWPRSDNCEDDQLNLPWPPDGGHQDHVATNDKSVESVDLSIPQNVALVKKRLDPRFSASRRVWINDQGESLRDYGVDMDIEVSDEEITI